MISILATVDGSKESLAVMPVLEKFAADMQAKVRLLTVADREAATPRRSTVQRATGGPAAGVPGAPASVTVSGESRPDPGWAESDDQAMDRVRAEAKSLLETTARPLRDRGLEVETDVVMGDDVARAIVEHARNAGVDLIAMATHGRSGLSALVQGSVATAVVRSGVAPVILVRPSQ